jgi:hypothetical protein
VAIRLAALNYEEGWFEGNADPRSPRTVCWFQIFSNLAELLQRGLQVLDDFHGQHVRAGQVGCVLQALVTQPEDVQVDLVARHQVLVAESSPTTIGLLFRPGGGPLLAVLRLEAGHELIQVFAAEGVLLEGEVLVGAEVVHPQLPGPGGGVEEEDVGLDTLGVEDAGGQAQQGVHVALVQQFAADDLARAALKED